MPLVVGVSFKRAGRIYDFDPNDIVLHEGDFVVTETSRGVEFGAVMTEPRHISETEIICPLKKITRKATQSDINRDESNRQKEKNAYRTCQQKIVAHNMPMKLLDAEYCFDGSQVTFYFSADSRVDFRELVKDLAGTLHSKVQLHQVGVRDEAKLFGGMGPCGRPLCCATFLNGFEPVSMKMAKEQSLFLNPLKFSGICGKLMCCLKYEYQIYRDAKDSLPAIGSMVTTPQGQGKVSELNVIKETVGVTFEDGTNMHCHVSELLGWTPRCPAQCGMCASHDVPEVSDLPEASDQSQVPESSGFSHEESITPEAVVAEPETATISPPIPAPVAQADGEQQPEKRPSRRRPNRRRRQAKQNNPPEEPSGNSG
jgi:cell fate regulator YaaT (PSP1 superfamily)